MIIGESRAERRNRKLIEDECLKRSTREYIDQFTTTERRDRPIFRSNICQRFYDGFVALLEK